MIRKLVEDTNLDREIADIYDKMDELEKNPNHSLASYRVLDSRLQRLLAQRDGSFHTRREVEPETDLAFMTEDIASANQVILEIFSEVDGMFPDASKEDVNRLLAEGETTPRLERLKTELLIHLILGELTFS